MLPYLTDKVGVDCLNILLLPHPLNEFLRQFCEPLHHGDLFGTLHLSHLPYDLPSSAQGGRSLRTGARPFRLFPRSSRSSKSRMVALLLCIFLGFLGVHRFYLGKIPTGILFLLTFGLFYVGWIWDIIMLIMNNAKDGNGAPLS